MCDVMDAVEDESVIAATAEKFKHCARDSRYTASNVKISDLPESGLRVAFLMVVLICPRLEYFGHRLFKTKRCL